jgi:hypothetical protein
MFDVAVPTNSKILRKFSKPSSIIWGFFNLKVLYNVVDKTNNEQLKTSDILPRLIIVPYYSYSEIFCMK